MRKHHLGPDLTVSAFGLGCMPMSGQNYGPADEKEGIATIRAALDAGVNFFDTAGTYGFDGANELLIGKAIKGRRDEAVICTKFGVTYIPYTDTVSVCSRPETIAPACEESLRRLGTDYIDLYLQHRVDPDVPIEDVWGALAELIAAGKVRHIGMSEPGMETLRRAHAVHPVAAIENEYSLFSRDPEDEVLPTIREMGIGIIPFAPLGRGFLSGAFRSLDDFPTEDFRRFLPRFQGENFALNLELVDKIAELAAHRGVSPIQLGLAWVIAQGDDVVPIPGTETRALLQQNLRAAEIELDQQELDAIDAIIPKGAFGKRIMPNDVYTGADAAPLPA